MPHEPLRRVLFPTPRKNDDGTSTRSIQRIRPKAEVTPVNFDSTPTFKQLVENSPVPLAVAAATAAMRAAKSAHTDRPIITEMTRAAEEVIKNSEYNSIRPPLPSPRSLSSPRFSAVHPTQSASASLPPALSPVKRHTGLVNTLRSIYTPRRASVQSIIPRASKHSQQVSDARHVNKSEATLAATQSLSRTLGKRVAPTSVRPPSSIPTTGNKLRKEHTISAGKQPSPRAKSDLLSRLFGVVPPLPVEDTVESPVGSSTSLEDANNEVATGQIEISTKTSESIERRKKDSHQFLKEGHRAHTPKQEKHVTPRMQTRSLKRARPRSNAMVVGYSKSGQPKKRRRMSEVLRLQKALESASWTDSLAIEKQTEVIVISDNMPTRPRADIVIKSRNRNPRESLAAPKVIRSTAARQITEVGRKSIPKRNSQCVLKPVTQKASRHANQEASRNRQKRQNATEAKRKRSSVKGANFERAGDGKKVVNNGPREDVVPKKRRKREVEQKKKAVDSLEKATISEVRKTNNDGNSLESAHKNYAEASIKTLQERHAPLKKRISAEHRNQNSVSKIEVNGADTGYEKNSRKTSNPIRLKPPVSGNVGVLQISNEAQTKRSRKKG